MISQPSSYLKAIYSTLVAIIGSLATVMVGDVTIGDITQGQWVVIAGAALAAFGGTYGISNRAVTQPVRMSGGTTGE